MSDKVKVQTCTGTGEIMNIECGFVPLYVKVYNNNDAGSLWPTLEWFSGMGAATALKCLKQIDSGSTGLSSQAKITTLGISEFAGETPGAVMVGTGAITSGLKALTGTSTKYLKDLRVGDVINLGGNQYTIATVTNNTTATIVEPAVKTETAAIMNRMSGRTAGFTISTDADINVSGEAIFCIALG